MKKVIITGGSSGLGLEISNLLLGKGIEVISLSRTKPNNKSQHIFVDFLNDDSIDSAMNDIIKKYSDFDTLILCAGSGEIEEIGEIKKDSLKNTMLLNLNSNILITNKLLDKIKENEVDIVVIGATIGYKSNKYMPVYSIAKWGLRGFVENIREVLKGSKSRVLNIIPGGMNTNSNVGEYGRETIIAKKTGNPISSLIDIKEVAGLIYNFLSLPKNMEISQIIINRK